MIQLKDICTKIGSGATPTGGKSAYLSQGISLIRSQNVLDYTFTMDGLAYINEDQAMKLNNVEVQKGDILLNITGDSVARVCIVPNNVLPARVNQHVAIIRVDEDKADNNYVLYSLIKSKKSLLSLAGGGATRNALTKKMIEEFEIELPQLSIQKKISAQLSEIDSKIAVNRRICENLEAQAQALFKHWFIDFAPFKNGKFVESELGMIPEGWRVGTLGEVAEVNPSRTLKKGVTATYLDMKNMPTSGSFPINWEDKEFAGGMKFKNGDTLMARITPCLENGKVAYVNFLKDGEVAFGSTEYIVMTAKESLFPEFLYTLCRFPSFVNYAVKNMNGSSGRQRVSGETISNYRIIIAPEVVYSSVKPIFKEYMLQIRKCGFENLRLSTLRDTLLPKLMSGQIKV